VRFWLRCRECGAAYEARLLHYCTECLAPLEVAYDHGAIRLTRETLSMRERSMWRYRELLPLTGEYARGPPVGWTPLRRCDRLGPRIGLVELYAKDDTANPTGSFKDRPASVAVRKALEFGLRTLACPSTGNLAAAVSAQAALNGLECCVFVPHDTEQAKLAQVLAYGAKVFRVRGTYDQANRLAAQAMEKFGWGIANINLRPYYAEGSKTLTFELVEQLGWRAPDWILVPTASGALAYATWKALKELSELGLIDEPATRIACVQPKGCAPVYDAFRRGTEEVTPVTEPRTIARSLAIGDPGDAAYALRAVRESKGLVVAVSDDEIIEAIKLLASFEGIFAEPAGAITIAAARALALEGVFDRGESVVCLVTGHGLKAPEAVLSLAKGVYAVEPSLPSLEATMTHA
jgi:threonine synthase